jgi:hypothetical protein
MPYQKWHICHCSSRYRRSYCHVLVHSFSFALIVAWLTELLVICNFFGFLLIVLSMAEMSSM